MKCLEHDCDDESLEPYCKHWTKEADKQLWERTGKEIREFIAYYYDLKKDKS